MATHTPFRLVLASDFHLELPPQGLAEVPEHLREALLEAPYRAAERVFDAVLAHHADCLVLSGDSLNAALTGPRGPLFLVRQFERLREQNVSVFWAGGEADPPDAWPTWAILPDNVHRFGRGDVEEFVLRREGWPLARVLGVSHDPSRAPPWNRFHPDPTGLFSLAVVYVPGEAALPAGSDIDFWALGGRHAAKAILADRRAADYPGSPQGRRPTEPGPHGCTLIEVDENGRVERHQLATDVLRFWRESLHAPEPATGQQLQHLCRQHIEQRLETQGDVLHLIDWRLHRDAPRPGEPQEHVEVELLDALRTEFGYRSPAAWSMSLEINPCGEVPSPWCQEDTFLGDFLRTVRHHQEHPEQELPLATYLGQQSDESLHALAKMGDRAGLLAQVAEVGVELLSDHAQ
jgi:exonuclease SbcD